MKLACLIILLLIDLNVCANIIVVERDSKSGAIQNAVDRALAGDTVIILTGIYYANDVLISRPISIIGNGNVVIDGSGKYEIFTISGSGVKVSGITFRNTGYTSTRDLAAITVLDANDVVLENNRFLSTYFGIHVSNSHHFTIRKNVFRGVKKTEQTSGNGIHLWKCNHALVEMNDVSGHRDGIYFEFVTHSQIIKNLSHNNIRYGLHFMFSNDDVYSGNRFSKNGAGVAVMFSKNVQMIANDFEDNWGAAAYGLLLKEINDSKIYNNNFIRNTVAIYMEGANRIVIKGNEFSGNGWAARVQASCGENEFTGNNFLSNTFDVATNGTMVLNSFNGNYWDKYEGYDLKHDGVGDIPYHPVSLYSMLIEQNGNALMLLRSFLVSLLDKAEKAIPSLTPVKLKDEQPLMKKILL